MSALGSKYSWYHLLIVSVNNMTIPNFFFYPISGNKRFLAFLSIHLKTFFQSE